MMPVSSASSPVDTAGSIATTIRTKSGIFRWTGQRVSSISARDQRAPGTSSNISALSSCRPSRVPSYLRTICCRNAGARLARLSYVEPRVITVVGSAISSRLKGIGAEFAAVLYLEGLFRHFENRRQLAAYAGLAPSPWKSGSVDHEQGISKAGNPRLRTTMIELAWMWVRYQPASALSCWFRQRVGSERGRIRRISIVALARKLLIALSRYINHGEIPAGAVVKPV